MWFILFIGFVVLCVFAVKGFDTWSAERRQAREQQRRERLEAALAHKWRMEAYSKRFLLKVRSLHNSDREEVSTDDHDDWLTVGALSLTGFSDRFMQALEVTALPKEKAPTA